MHDQPGLTVYGFSQKRADNAAVSVLHRDRTERIENGQRELAHGHAACACGNLGGAEEEHARAILRKCDFHAGTLFCLASVLEKCSA